MINNDFIQLGAERLNVSYVTIMVQLNYVISLQVLTKKKNLEGYIKIHGPHPCPLGYSEPETYSEPCQKSTMESYE